MKKILKNFFFFFFIFFKLIFNAYSKKKLFYLIDIDYIFKNSKFGKINNKKLKNLIKKN